MANCPVGKTKEGGEEGTFFYFLASTLTHSSTIIDRPKKEKEKRERRSWSWSWGNDHVSTGINLHALNKDQEKEVLPTKREGWTAFFLKENVAAFDGWLDNEGS